ncbi:hypothetical protein EJB05_14964, partial [Eragrostis curvula]
MPLSYHFERAALCRLSIEIQSASPDSVAAWLLVAARRLAGSLKFRNLVPQGNGVEEDEDTDDVVEDEEECEQRGSFELPCFESATAVSLNLGFLGLSLPAAGVCSRLTKLSLSRVRFEGPWELGDAISSPRCPFLTKLSVRYSEGLTNLTINSRSLLRVNLRGLRGLRRLAIEAPALGCLIVSHCFYFGHDQPVVSISAPQLEWLQWLDSYDPSSMYLDTMERIDRLAPFFFIVYGDEESITNNHSCVRLLQHFKVIETLILSLLYPEGLDNCSYLMDDMTMLPDITNLHLIVVANGHAFGASIFHVLRMCSGIKMLDLKLNIQQGNEDDEEGREQRGSFELPCFESATAVSLDLGFLGLSVPAAGVFSRLTNLCLSRIRFEGPWELGDAISSPRCPFLTKLSVRDSKGLTILTINSRSLRCLNLRGLLGLRRLAIEAPALACLTVAQCFYFGHDQPVVSISAPQLERLQWLDSYDPTSMHLDIMERIVRLVPFFFIVYGGQDSITNNHSCLRLLQHFKVIETLVLSLLYLEGLDNCSYLMDDMTMLPEIRDLQLIVMANGHAFGASTFHVLRKCSGIRMLHLKLDMAEVKSSFV